MSSSSGRTTLAGTPTISELSGNSLPSVISAPAPTRLLAPIFAPFSTVAPMPIRLFGPMVQPCSIALWPMVQSAPMVMGYPGSVCSTHSSWMFTRAPTSISSLSPRMTVPNQTLASSPSRTLPITVASGAIQ